MQVPAKPSFIMGREKRQGGKPLFANAGALPRGQTWNPVAAGVAPHPGASNRRRKSSNPLSR
jgi:hypothetical protein